VDLILFFIVEHLAGAHLQKDDKYHKKIKLDKLQLSKLKEKRMIENEFQNKDDNARLLMMNYLVQEGGMKNVLRRQEGGRFPQKNKACFSAYTLSLPTKYLDKTVISQFSAQSLANASDLVGLNKTNKLRRTGNLLSEVFEIEMGIKKR
jgi:hypothetical protein